MARYLKRRESDVPELRRALESSDFETIRTTGHNLFGSGGAYGLDEISALGQRIELAAENRDGPRIEALIGHLECFLRGVKVR